MKHLSKFNRFKIIESELSNLSDWQVEDISFKIKTKSIPLKKGILLHELITIEVWNTPDGYKENIEFQPYHIVFGDSSMAIFDAFDLNETAGLNRSDCQKHIDKLTSEGKTETWDGAYIAGLTNWAGDQLYQFFNAPRVNYPGYLHRLMSHESLHLARNLISLESNEFMRTNQGKGEWWSDPRAKWVNMSDDNEEYFAETLERCTSIAYSRWDKISDKVKEIMPPKPQSPEPPKLGGQNQPAK